MEVEILGAIAAFLLAAGAGWRRLVMLRRMALVTRSQLDTHLQRRHQQAARLLGVMEDRSRGQDELRGLTAALQQVVAARGIPARAEAENELMYHLRCFTSAVDRASGLAAQPRIGALCEELAVAEEQIALAVQSYNRQVMAWNRKIHQIPGSWIAALCRFQPIEYFVLDDPVVTGGHERRARCWSSE